MINLENCDITMKELIERAYKIKPSTTHVLIENYESSDLTNKELVYGL